MTSELEEHVKEVLEKYTDVFDKLYNIEGAIVPYKYWLSNIPKKYALRMSDVKKIKKTPKYEILVIEPQLYDYVSRLNNKSEAITKDYFYEDDNCATTGSGADKWIKVSIDFIAWLEKRILRITKLVKKLLKTATK
jgi:hypothetical protein